MKERFLILKGDVTGDSPSFRGIAKVKLVILRGNLWKN